MESQGSSGGLAAVLTKKYAAGVSKTSSLFGIFSLSGISLGTRKKKVLDISRESMRSATWNIKLLSDN